MKRKRDGWTASDEITFHEAASLIDYLHGDVSDREAATACHYEYARESSVLLKIAARLQTFASEGGGQRLSLPSEVLKLTPYQWPLLPPFVTFLRFCSSFPCTGWNELSRVERNKVPRYRPSSNDAVLPMPDAVELHAHCIPHKLQVIVNEANSLLAQGHPIPPSPPIVTKQGSNECVVFDID